VDISSSDFACDSGLWLGDASVFELVVPTPVPELLKLQLQLYLMQRKKDSSNSKDKKGKTMEVVFRVQMLHLRRPTRHLGLDPTARTVGASVCGLPLL
jgi:hypothetical protein